MHHCLNIRGSHSDYYISNILYIILRKIGLIANNDFDENNITENYFGEINKLCIYCDAKHFHCEMNTEKCFILIVVIMKKFYLIMKT